MSEIETLNGKDSLWYCFHGDKIVPSIGKTAKEGFDHAAGKLGPEAAFSNTVVKLMRTTKEKETLLDAVLDVLRLALVENHRQSQQITELHERCGDLHDSRRELRGQCADLQTRLDVFMRTISDERRSTIADSATTTLASNGQGLAGGEDQGESSPHLQNGAEPEIPESTVTTIE
jgi:hypothetical protein